MKIFCIGDTKVLLLDKDIVPFSFLHSIFISKAEYVAGRIEPEVLEHELAHVHQKHSIDIIFIELVAAIAWFNPFIYLYRQSIKINHELLADAAVVGCTNDIRSYQHVLLQRTTAQNNYPLASSFNFYTTKKHRRKNTATYN